MWPLQRDSDNGACLPLFGCERQNDSCPDDLYSPDRYIRVPAIPGRESVNSNAGSVLKQATALAPKGEPNAARIINCNRYPNLVNGWRFFAPAWRGGVSSAGYQCDKSPYSLSGGQASYTPRD